MSAEPRDAEPQGDGEVSAPLLSTPARRRQLALRITLACVLLLAVTASAGAVGSLIGNRSSKAGVADGSVDAGFARDMSTHHTQAITMANYERDITTDPSLKLLAYDIETAQNFQLGQMQGWLDSWGLARGTARQTMAWMAGHDHLLGNGVMPGMATPAQIDQLETLKGTALDVDFLQLLIHHHQGGLPMEQYAAQHASELYVRSLAVGMVATQSSEIVAMEQLLRELGASPLPAPTS